ncbi:MAG: Gfo/Idh/MocA family oxidoreductase [Planctomycetes bacterium]|nr:Gfo/Idh/MocA family oxidoreductase [Planctomycetota bacterium]
MTQGSSRREFLHTAGGTMAAIALWPGAELARAALRVTEPFTVGLIGVGKQGRAILSELQKIEHVNIKAVCDVDESRLRGGLRRVQGAEGFADYREMLDTVSDLKAVFVATPTHMHREPAVHALRSGKHVYCEAPLASTIKDCREIAMAARDAGTSVFQTGMLGRTDPVYTLANTFVRAGDIRDIIGMRAQWHKKTSWRIQGPDAASEKARNWRLDPAVSIGLAGEVGTQQFDVIHWFARQYPVSVRGSGGVMLHKDGREIPDTIVCDFTFADGTSFHYDASLANSYEGEYEQLYGTNGTVKLAWRHGWLFKEADAPTMGWEVYANRQQFHNEEGITLIADATQLAAQGRLKDGVGLQQPPLFYGIEEFLRSAINGSPVQCSASEGLRAAVVGILANQAVMTNSEVAIDPELFKEG